MTPTLQARHLVAQARSLHRDARAFKALDGGGIAKALRELRDDTLAAARRELGKAGAQ